MTEEISTLEVRQRLGDILNRVALRNDQFIIECKGKPLAAVVPVARLEQMRRAARMHLLQVLERQEEEADWGHGVRLLRLNNRPGLSILLQKLWVGLHPFKQARHQCPNRCHVPSRVGCNLPNSIPQPPR